MLTFENGALMPHLCLPGMCENISFSTKLKTIIFGGGCKQSAKNVSFLDLCVVLCIIRLCEVGLLESSVKIKALDWVQYRTCKFSLE